MEAQEAACRAHAARLGPVVGVFRDEGLSGKRAVLDRPGLAAMVAYTLSHPGTVVVAYSLSRLGRSQRVIWSLLDEQGRYHLQLSSATEPFDTTTSMGRAFLGMLATFAQLESDLASERTKAALSYVKSQGKVLGPPRIGKELADRVKELNRDIARVGRYPTAEELADELNLRGIRSARGKKWHPRTVRAALAVE